MRLARAGVLSAVLSALAAPSVALDSSPYPAPRAEAVILKQIGTRLAPSLRAAPQTTKAVRLAVGQGVRLSPVPAPRPALTPRHVSRTVTRPPGTPSKIGKICGSRKIRGREAASIAGTLPGCGVRNPVQVVEVEGVRLSTASTMTCDTARALREWVKKGVKKSVRRKGGGVAELRVAAHYSCRTRNHQPGAKISEHGKGNAIDISAIVLKDGTVITLLKGWDDRRQGKILRKMHKAACGPFGTVLGPESDRFHKDHFHFDVARHRGGPYCR